MRVAIIGAGGQGVGLAGLLVQEQDVEEIIVADFNPAALDSARDYIQRLEDRSLNTSISYQQLDASDVEALKIAVAGTTVIANCTIPTFNIPIMTAALEVGAHYLDLFASPYEAEGVPYSETIDAQFDLNGAFSDAGITAVPSIGISPGWTSLAAQKAIDSLDSVDHVVIRFFDWIDTDELFLAVSPLVILQEWFGAPYPVQILDGTPTEVDLLGSAEEFDFLEPLGKQVVYTVTAHPDIVLIDRFAGKPIGRLEEKFGIGLGSLETTDIIFKAMQKAANTPAETAGQNSAAGVAMLQQLESAFIPPIQYETLVKDGRIRDAQASYTIEIAGQRDGVHERHLSYYSVSPETVEEFLPGMSGPVYATVGGTPIEILLALGRQEIQQQGVIPINQLEKRDQIMARLAERKIDIVERIITED